MKLLYIKLYLFFAVLLNSVYLQAQLIVTNPSIPTDNQAVTITFDATQGNKGLMGYTGDDVYAHTAVITDLSSTGTNWRYKKADWKVNLPECKLTRTGTDTYELTMSPSIREWYGVPDGEKIIKMAFVFRNGDGSKSGREVGGTDIFVDVFENELNVNFIKPTDDYMLLDSGQVLNIQINASLSDSISLFLDDVRIHSAAGQSLTDSVTVSGNINHQLVAIAYGASGMASDTVHFRAHPNVVTESVPAGLKDGINYIDDKTVGLVLFAPHKKYVYVIGDFNNWEVNDAYMMKKDGDHYWLTVGNLTPGKEYVFQYFIDGELKIADPYSEKTSDPRDNEITVSVYPNLIPYPTGKTTEIASVIQTNQSPYQWTVTDFTPPPTDKLVIYELLIRDFTSDGTIHAVLDTLSYLKNLGVNAIELMPFSEFENNDSWGYNQSFYFAPDKSYGTKNDFKAFIDACHKNGIAVIQDLVLNHAYGKSPLVRMYFDQGKPTAQSPWFNITSPNQTYSYGYDLNHESPYTQQLVDSVTSFWMTEYKIDGFRYDFTKGFTNTPGDGHGYDASRIAILERMASEVWKRKGNAIVILEHFADNSEETVLANDGMLLWNNNNKNFGQATMSYNDSGGSWDFSWISYKNRGWDYPRAVGYMESHDEEREMFRNVTYGKVSGDYSIKDTITAFKRMELAYNFFIPVPGPKMIWEFGELGYDVGIDYNGRTGRKPAKWKYQFDPNRKHLFNTVKSLIELKLNEPVFSTSNFTLDASGKVKRIELLNTDENDVVILGNFDVADAEYSYKFPQPGIWHEFYTGNSIEVGTLPQTLTLKPGEFRLYSTKDMSNYNLVTSAPEYKTLNSKTLVYPNPFDSQIMIESEGKIRNLELYNSFGQMVLNKNGEQKTSVIKTNSVLPGIYLLKINFTDGKTEIRRIIKR
ncbi:MAG: alpha-amylase family glycosyl hydrolase [Prolixibacteraceae bacterium]|jgi:1,4-alpha-glucan branching enzyme